MDWAAILFVAAQSSVPLLIAGLGELITEKSGVLNLGVEGMMIVGAVVAFIVTFHTASILLGVVAAAAAAAALGMVFAVLTVGLRASQVATGLALTIFGLGFSAFIGLPYEGKTLSVGAEMRIPLLADIPFIGDIFFQQDAFFYFAIVMVVATFWFLQKTRAGLILIAVGENHHAGYAVGYPVGAIRFAACAYGAAMCGIGGAYLSVIYTPLWAQDMTAGRGWIVLALVVFAAWQPWRLLIGAYLFGFVSILQLFWQAGDNAIAIPAQFFNMAPYIAAIAALMVISIRYKHHSAPRCLAQPLPVKA